MDKAEPEMMGQNEIQNVLAPTLISHCFPDSCFPGGVSCGRSSCAQGVQCNLWRGVVGVVGCVEAGVSDFLLKKIFFLEVQPINNVVTVSGEQQRDSIIHIHVSILPQIPLPSRLPHNTEQSSLCCTAGPCWLSILNTAVCPCPSQTPYPLSPATISSFSKSLSLLLFCK